MTTTIEPQPAAAAESVFRVDAALKEEAQKVLEEMGLDVETAVRVFLKKVVATKAIPFALSAEAYPVHPSYYHYTPEQEEEILEASREAKDPANVVGPFENMDEAIAYLRKACHES